MENQTEALSQDDDFITSFENCTLPPDGFHHRDHIKLSWLYLRRYEPIEALTRVSEGIKRYATFNGKAERYHETITWAYFFLIRERIERGGTSASWQEFINANEDLFNWENNVLKRYYNKATLTSELARATFLMPDNPDSSK